MERNTTTYQEEFGFSSYSYKDDLEMIREIESETTKSESGKIVAAGAIAAVSAVGIIAAALLSNVYYSELFTAVQAGLIGVGLSAAFYGVIKTLRKVFGKTLNFPTISAQTKVFAQAYNEQQANKKQQNAAQTNTTYRPQSPGERKELRRSRTNRVFAGVAGGLGEYLGVSPALIRFAFVVATFMSFPIAPIAYLIMVMAIPKNIETWKNRKK